jgi:hypothetical protein
MCGKITTSRTGIIGNRLTSDRSFELSILFLDYRRRWIMPLESGGNASSHFLAPSCLNPPDEPPGVLG